MMHLFINSMAASAGGGLTYIRNVIPYLASTPKLRVTIAMRAELREEFRAFPAVEFVEMEIPPVRRFWYEQSTLPRLIRQCHADVLLSTGNFALRSSPVPQILLSRNSIYTSEDFYSDLRSRGEYFSWLDTHVRGWLAKRSIRWADITVAPSKAFATELCSWTGMPIRAVYHGFDYEAFTHDSNPLAPEVEEKLQQNDESLKILFVSHYNYYRNFETLIRALPLLRHLSGGRSVKLLLTCKFLAGENPGPYHPQAAEKLVRGLGVSDMVIELGTIPYHNLHQLYRRSDVYVTPAYTETFAHPLVEAMASGLPVVASDLAVHREICGDAAIYFERFSSEALARCVAQVAGSPETSSRMTASGFKRSRHFSWRRHVEEIVELLHMLIDSKVRMRSQ
jgi:glycosyltransferase involved in cell wall biosynthesis